MTNLLSGVVIVIMTASAWLPAVGEPLFLIGFGASLLSLGALVRRRTPVVDSPRSEPWTTAGPESPVRAS